MKFEAEKLNKLHKQTSAGEWICRGYLTDEESSTAGGTGPDLIRCVDEADGYVTTNLQEEMTEKDMEFISQVHTLWPIIYHYLKLGMIGAGSVQYYSCEKCRKTSPGAPCFTATKEYVDLEARSVVTWKAKYCSTICIDTDPKYANSGSKR